MDIETAKKAYSIGSFIVHKLSAKTLGIALQKGLPPTDIQHNFVLKNNESQQLHIDVLKLGSIGNQDKSKIITEDNFHVEENGNIMNTNIRFQHYPEIPVAFQKIEQYITSLPDNPHFTEERLNKLKQFVSEQTGSFIILKAGPGMPYTERQLQVLRNAYINKANIDLDAGPEPLDLGVEKRDRIYHCDNIGSYYSYINPLITTALFTFYKPYLESLIDACLSIKKAETPEEAAQIYSDMLDNFKYPGSLHHTLQPNSSDNNYYNYIFFLNKYTDRPTHQCALSILLSSLSYLEDVQLIAKNTPSYTYIEECAVLTRYQHIQDRYWKQTAQNIQTPLLDAFMDDYMNGAEILFNDTKFLALFNKYKKLCSGSQNTNNFGSDLGLQGTIPIPETSIFASWETEDNKLPVQFKTAQFNIDLHDKSSPTDNCFRYTLDLSYNYELVSGIINNCFLSQVNIMHWNTITQTSNIKTPISYMANIIKEHLIQQINAKIQGIKEGIQADTITKTLSVKDYNDIAPKIFTCKGVENIQTLKLQDSKARIIQVKPGHILKIRLCIIRWDKYDISIRWEHKNTSLELKKKISINDTYKEHWKTFCASFTREEFEAIPALIDKHVDQFLVNSNVDPAEKALDFLKANYPSETMEFHLNATSYGELTP